MTYHALGIGDILIKFLSDKSPININLSHYDPNNIKHFTNPENRLEFTINLLKKLCEENDVPYESYVNFVKSRDLGLVAPLSSDLKSIGNLNFETNSLHPEIDGTNYIVFHTKARFSSWFDYSTMKDHLSKFYRDFKCKYKIVLLGERVIDDTHEKKVHGITTIYEELIQLKYNNELIDLTEETTLNNLNINNFMGDIHIVKNAVLNVGVGHGGQYCNCVIFGTKSLFYTHPKLVWFNENILKEKNVECVFDIREFFQSLPV